MLVNCYYYAPHNHTMLADHIRDDLARMADMGVDIVSVCVQESQLANWHRKRLYNMVELVHEYGMKIHAVPNRWAGLLAGWLDGLGNFAFKHTETWVRDREGRPRYTHRATSCTQHPAVKAHFQEHLQLMFDRFAFDGIVWDEPSIVGACYCDFCRQASGLDGLEEPADAWQRRKLADFLDDMSAYCKNLRPETMTLLFAEAGDLLFAEQLAATKHIDYIGSDGHVRKREHSMHRMKNTIFQAHEAYYPLMKSRGHQTVFLLEAQRHRDEDLAHYLEVMEEAFQLPMDQLMFYYSAHEMSPENEKIFNRATWEKIKSLTI